MYRTVYKTANNSVSAITPFDLHGISQSIADVAGKFTIKKHKHNMAVVISENQLPDILGTQFYTFLKLSSHRYVPENTGVFHIEMVKLLKDSDSNKEHAAPINSKKLKSVLAKLLANSGFTNISENDIKISGNAKFKRDRRERAGNKTFGINGAFLAEITAKISDEDLAKLSVNGIGQKKSYGFGQAVPQ